MPEALPLILNNEGGEFYPKDYFYRFNYNKVYTVSSFQGSTYPHSGALGFGNNRYLGLKDLVPGEEEDCTDNVTPPVNFGTKNYTFSILIADVLLLLEYLFNFITLLFFNTGSQVLHSIAEFCLEFGSPLGGLGRRLKKLAYTFQDSGQKGLGLITYPECEECSSGDFGVTSDQEAKKIKFCKVGEGRLYGFNASGNLRATQIGYGPQYLVGKCLERYNSGHPEIIPIQDDAFNPFFPIMENYYISEGLIPLTKENTPKGSWFYEHTFIDWWFVTFSEMRFVDGDGYWSGESGFFNYNIYYKYYDEDGQDWTSGAVNNDIKNVALEDGCDIYDSPYNESLVSKYYTSETGDRSPVLPTLFNPYTMDMVGSNLVDDGYKLVRHYDDKSYSPFTPSGQSEFKNGMFYVVPGSQTNARLIGILKEHRIRKRVGKLFCGGIVSYSFIDSWLSGSLYFHQFKAKRVYKMKETAIRYCRETVRFVGNNINRFYYRSTPILTGTTMEFVGGVSGLVDQRVRRINHPTTFVDLGPRDEFIKEICIDQSLDPNCSVSRIIGSTSFKNFGELIGLAINYRLDTTNNNYGLNSFFKNGGFSKMGFENVFAGDILQLISINSEVGIEEFDLQSPKYLGYSYQYLDPDLFPNVFKKNGLDGKQYWGPVPITFELDDSGERVRLCLNEPTHLNYTGGTVQGRLTESSQPVPFYLWDKKGTGFGGTSEDTSDDQSWDYNSFQLQPLQGMTFGYDHGLYDDEYNGMYNDDSDKYMLLPMTNDFSGVTVPNMNVVGVGVDFDDVITGKTSLGDTLELGPSPKIELYNGEYPGYTILLVDTGTIEDPLTGRLYVRIGPAMGNSTHLGQTITNGFYKMDWTTNNDFLILPKKDYYSGTKQILSTPFHFYFGLKAGKTGLDKFIDLYGPKGAFPSAE
jgi:hypothetical protein